MAVGAGIVNDHEIARLHRRQLAGNGKLVVILAQGPRDIAHTGSGDTFLADDRDVVIGAIASRMNSKKIAAVHNIKDSLPDIAYGIGMIIAYIIWSIIIIAPLLFLGAL